MLTRSASGQHPVASQAPRNSARRWKKTSRSSLGSIALQPSAPTATLCLSPRAMLRSSIPSSGASGGPAGLRGSQPSVPPGGHSCFQLPRSTTLHGSKLQRPSSSVATSGSDASPLTCS